MSKKILFVVDTLAQHGAERYLYEILKVLVTQDLKVLVCSTAVLNEHHRFYIEPIHSLGIPVVILPVDLYPDTKPLILRKILNSFAYRISRKIKKNYINDKIKNNLYNLSRQYDIVSIIKWEVYICYADLFDRLKHKKIHIMSSLAQYPSYPYEHLPKGKTDFITYYFDQKKELLNDRQQFANHRFFNIPLLLDNEDWLNQYSPKNDGILRIGMFSRIHYDQPTFFIFSIIHELKSRNIPVELYFFGRYYDENFYNHYLKTVEVLKIQKEVKFMGHTESIAKSIKVNCLDVGVMNSVDALSGYSGIEIQSHGLPVVFFNIIDSGYSNNDFPIVCNTISEISDVLKVLSQAKGKLRSLSDKTFEFTKNEYGINSNKSKIISYLTE